MSKRHDRELTQIGKVVNFFYPRLMCLRQKKKHHYTGGASSQVLQVCVSCTVRTLPRDPPEVPLTGQRQLTENTCQSAPDHILSLFAEAKAALPEIRCHWRQLSTHEGHGLGGEIFQWFQLV